MGLGWVYCQYPCCLGQSRFVVAVFALAAVLIGYCQRASLNIGMVEMTERKEGSALATCPVDASASTVIKDIGGGKVDWSEEQQGYNLGAFFVGYLVSHIPAGIFCDKYGPRYPLFAGMLMSTVSTGLIPLAATTWPSQWWLVAVLRVFTGIGQGGLFPGVSSLMQRWIPPVERATVGGVVFAANGFGLVLGNLCTGMVINETKNWPIAFYMWAAIGCVYCALFLVYAFSDPRTHPHIHSVEFDYLQATMSFKQPMKIPLRGILKDKSLYGLIFVQCGHDIIMFFLASNLPKYLNQVLGLQIRDNALVACIFTLQWLSGFLAGMLADYLIKKKNANVTFMRKFYSVISNMGSTCAVATAVLLKCNKQLVITCFAFALFFKGIYFAGGKVNIMDISINHSGLVMSIVNGLGAITGFVIPYVIGVVATENTFRQWEYVVAGITAFELLTLIIYVAISKAERSSWDYTEGEAPPTEKPHKWLNQMSASDHELRLVRDKQANENRKEAARVAKAKLKEELEARMAEK